MTGTNLSEIRINRTSMQLVQRLPSVLSPTCLKTMTKMEVYITDPPASRYECLRDLGKLVNQLPSLREFTASNFDLPMFQHYKAEVGVGVRPTKWHLADTVKSCHVPFMPHFDRRLPNLKTLLVDDVSEKAVYEMLQQQLDLETFFGRCGPEHEWITLASEQLVFTHLALRKLSLSNMDGAPMLSIASRCINLVSLFLSADAISFTTFVFSFFFFLFFVFCFYFFIFFFHE